MDTKLHTQLLQPISLEQSIDSKVNECIDILEIDNDLLMELLDDTKEEETLVSEVDSLEKENNCYDQLPAVFSNACELLNPDLIHAHDDCEDCSLDDILYSLNGHECSVSSTSLVDDLLDWVEMDIGMDLPSNLIDHQWQFEGRGCNSFYYGSTGEYVEQGFCPLWD